MGRSSRDDRAQLSAIARRAMIERGMEPDFSPAVQRELAAIPGPAGPGDGARDLRELPWASIDNDDSRDLDQLTVAEPLARGQVRILVAIADVGALVRMESAIDDHAQKRTNLTEERRTQARLAALKGLDEKSMIVYPTKGKAKHTVTVFTDIDCGYCRKLHQGMAEMNNLGITVRYLSYPRAGVGSESYKKATDVWCSRDRNKAMDKAKANQAVTDAQSCDAPIKNHMAIANSFGVTGTPAMVLDDGHFLPGYLPPQQLLAVVEGKAKL